MQYFWFFIIFVFFKINFSQSIQISCDEWYTLCYSDLSFGRTVKDYECVCEIGYCRTACSYNYSQLVGAYPEIEINKYEQLKDEIVNFDLSTILILSELSFLILLLLILSFRKFLYNIIKKCFVFICCQKRSSYEQLD